VGFQLRREILLETATTAKALKPTAHGKEIKPYAGPG
jgi:hypothetical protein